MKGSATPTPWRGKLRRINHARGGQALATRYAWVRRWEGGKVGTFDKLRGIGRKVGRWEGFPVVGGQMTEVRGRLSVVREGVGDNWKSTPPGYEKSSFPGYLDEPAPNHGIGLRFG